MKKLILSITFIMFITVINFIKPSAAFAATLSLSPATTTKVVGDSFSVDIVLDTTGVAVGGATAILTYDTAKLQVQGTAITPGTIFGSTAPFTNTIDASTGTIRYDSGTLGTAYTGRGTLATITFRALAVGSAQVNFTFNPSATTGTSLVAAASGPTNLLTAVNNGIYTVTATATSTLPPTGALEDTLVVVAGGIAFLVFGVFLAKRAILNANQ